MWFDMGTSNFSITMRWLSFKLCLLNSKKVSAVVVNSLYRTSCPEVQTVLVVLRVSVIMAVLQGSVRKMSVVISLVVLRMAVCCAGVAVPLKKGGEFLYGNFMPGKNGWVLQKNDSLLSQIEVRSDMECASFCVWHHLCLSVNVEITANKHGKVVCQLMSYGGTDYLSYLVKKDGFIQMSMETICSTNPCDQGKNMTCFAHVNNADRKYSCACANSNSKPCETGSIKCNALGIQDGTIKNSHMTASSVHKNSNWAAHKARLGSGSYWAPEKNEGQKSWLQVDLLTSTTVMGIATQGDARGASRWVTAYRVVFSMKRKTWSKYRETGVNKIFKGNVNRNAIVKHDLKEPFVAKLVRILPKTWKSRVVLRMELYGCYH